MGVKMPIYEFKCKSCGTGFEQLTKISELDSVACPKCESGEVEKLMSGFAVSNSGGSFADASPCEGGACDYAPPGGCCSGGTCGLH